VSPRDLYRYQDLHYQCRRGAAFNVTNIDRSDYSPDGKKIAFTGYKGLGTDDDEDFDHEIYTINVSGGSKSQVTNTKYWASNPAWGSRP
jgi:Tol biopolymer transport system component